MDSEQKGTKTTESGHQSGWRQMKSTSAFRAINFELYVKPNKVVMTSGVITLAGCLGYIIYMNITDPYKENTYTAIKEDGSLTRVIRTSKWD